MELKPQIIVSGFSLNKEKKAEMTASIAIVKKEFLKRGISISIAPENFTSRDVSAWIADIGNNEDFYINFQEGDVPQVFAQNSDDLSIAQHFSDMISQWTDTDFLVPDLISSQTDEISTTLASLPLNVWNVVLPNHITEKEIVFSIMGCITDLYTRKHDLISEDKVWPFRDVPSSHFAFEAIKKAKNKNILTGYKGNIFQPDAGITRGEMLYILDKLGLL